MPEIKQDIRATTFIVAANDSLHKNMADYVCDGTNDEVEIQAAIDALPAGGGKIILLDGQFVISSTINLSKPVTLEGMGATADEYAVLRSYGITEIYLANNSDCTMIALTATAPRKGITIRRIRLDGNMGNQATGHGVDISDSTGVVLENLYLKNIKQSGIYSLKVDYDLRSLKAWNVEVDFAVYGFNFSELWESILNHCNGFNCSTAGFRMGGGEANEIFGHFGDNGRGVELTGGDSFFSLDTRNNSNEGVAIIGSFVDSILYIRSLNDGAIFILLSATTNNCSFNINAFNSLNNRIVVEVPSSANTFGGNVFLLAMRNAGGTPATGIYFSGAGGNGYTGTAVYGRIGEAPTYGFPTPISFQNTAFEKTVRFYLSEPAITPVNVLGKSWVRAQNTSGGNLTTGNVVSYEAAAGAVGFETPTAIGDPKVWGMLAEDINDAAFGYIQTQGGTVLLDATNVGGGAIVIGDLLCTEVGNRARKAAAGHVAFAIALEGMDAADGIIDALLVTPRQL